jgi:MFS family permease
MKDIHMTDKPTSTVTPRPAMSNTNIKGLSANIILLGIVSFLNDVSSEMIIPILPMFLRSLGGAGLAVGLAGGLRDSIPSILNVLSGYWSDKVRKRKIFVWAGYLSSAVFKLFLTLSKTSAHAVIFSALERTGKGLRTPARDAIIAESAATQRGKGFGIHRAFDTSGAILGSIIAFLLSGVLGLGFKLVILIAGVIAFASLVPLRFVKESKGDPQPLQKINLRELPRSLKLFIAAAGVFALGNFSYMFFILRVQQAFTGKLSVAMPILLYILFNIFYAAFAVPFGNLSDRIGRGKIIILGYLLFSLTSFGFARLDAAKLGDAGFNTLPAFIILFAIYGVAYAAIESNQRAYASDLSPAQLKATALGVFHMTMGLMALPASLAAGALWQKVAPSATFIYGGVLGLVSVLLLAIFMSSTGSPQVSSTGSPQVGSASPPQRASSQ